MLSPACKLQNGRRFRFPQRQPSCHVLGIVELEWQRTELLLDRSRIFGVCLVDKLESLVIVFGKGHDVVHGE